ncbi:MAG TPA: hypothetical protein PK698_06545 [Bacilli bacterium]|nr:hypothetical protein [Bacilli bacterium]
MDPIELELQRKYGSANTTNMDPIEAELAQKYGTSTTPVESTGFKPLTMEDIGSSSPSPTNTKSVTLPKSNYKPETLSSSAGYFQATPKVRVRDVVREGANILGSGYKIVGDALASGLASKSKDVKGAMDSLSTLQDQQTKLGVLISKMRKEGKDTSKLQKIFDDNNKYIKDNGGMESIIPAVEMTNKQLAGGLAEVGLDAITAGTSGVLAKNMKSFKIAKPIVSKSTIPTVAGQFKAGSKAIAGGGALGYGCDVSNKLQMEEEKPFKPGIGTAIGAGIPTLGLASKFSKGSKVDKIVSGRLKELDKLSNTKIGLKKAVSNAKKKGIDVIDIISKSDLLDGAVDNTGTVSTKVEGGAVSQVMDQIRPYEDAVKRNLEIEGNTINIQNIKDKLIEAINNSSLKAGNKSTALSAIKKELSGLMLDAGETGDVPISLIHDSKIDKYSTINYDNPQSSKIDKIIAEAYKKIVEDNTTVIPVKKINQELSKFYTIKKFLEKLDGSKVEGGRLGKYFARTIGGIAGSQFGPLGALAGSELGGLIKGASMSNKFRGKTGKMLNISEDLIGAVNFEKNAGEVMKSKINRPYPIALPEANKSVIMAKEAPDASRLYSQEEAVAYLKDSGFGSGKVDTRDSFTKWADNLMNRFREKNRK